MEKMFTQLKNTATRFYFFAGRKWKFVFLLMLLFSVSASVYSQAKNWSLNSHTKFEWQPEKGRIKMSIMYYDSKGGSSNSQAGFIDNHSGYLDIYFEGIRILVRARAGGNNLEVWADGTVDEGVWEWDGQIFKDGENGREHWTDIYWNIPDNRLNETVAIRLNGKWGRNAATDEDIKNVSVSIPTSLTFHTITTSTPEFTTQANNPVAKISWNKTDNAGNADNLGKLYLREQGSTQNLAEMDATEMVNAQSVTRMSGDFYIDAGKDGKINLNKTNEYVVVQEFKPHNRLTYQKESNTAIVKAFPQVKPNSFKSTYDQSTGKATLSWEIENGSVTDFISDKPFRVRSVGDNVFSADEDYTKSQTKYSYTFDIPDDIDNRYSFSINRMDNSAWDNHYKQEIELYAQPIHLKTSSLDVALLNNKEALIKWDIQGSAWSSGTRVTLSRMNLTNGTSEDINLTKDDFLKKEYTDDFIQICRRYSYKISIVPNEAYSSIPVVHSGATIMPVEIGNVSALQVSKGYFADRVELQWESSGRFDHFRVRRVEYGKQNADTVLVATINDLGSGNVLAEDNRGSRGVYYTYLVDGVVICDDEKKYSNLLHSVGFRSPTGNVYGRITYENGQAVPGAEVLLDSDLPETGKSIALNGTNAYMEVPGNIALNAGDFTLQAWVAPGDAQPNGTIIAKEGEYELSFANGNFRFSVGAAQVETAYAHPTGVEFTHISAVKEKDTLWLYVNGKLQKKEVASIGTAVSENPIFMGKNSGGNFFKGRIDEVRLWNTALDSAVIVRDYSRLLYGGERGLVAYWRFNEGVAGEFYDASYQGDTYHANHGRLINAVYDAVIPSKDQLSLKGITDNDGNYAISGIPFTGQGTMYRLIPRYGTHQFDPVQQQRLIADGSLSHTCNFTDKSSFSVKGYVYYANSTVPVKDASFEIDGLPASANNRPVLTDAQGKFEINVPVGVHDVRVVKSNHTFEHNGRITNSDGSNVNYQEPMENIHLYDKTRIKFIGRVAGGAVQEAYPLGHSLSKNNLGDDISITLQLVGGQGKEIAKQPITETVEHLRVRGEQTARTNDVNYAAEFITIYPNRETGEFVAMIIPENFNITSVNAIGYGNILEGGRSVNIDFTNSLMEKAIPYEYTDTLVTPRKVYNDTVKYHYSQQFIKRLTPSISLTQLDKNGQNLEYYGEEEMTLPNNMGVIPAMVDGAYILGHPILQQNKTYTLKASVFEEYAYYNASGDLLRSDKVPTADGIIYFSNNLRDGTLAPDTVSINTKGFAMYSFVTGKPNLSSPDATKSMGVSVKIGDEMIQGDALTAIILGNVATGNNFVTPGPDRVINVVRDPPGSNSYGYIEKGTVTEKSEIVKGGVMLSENVTQKFVVGLQQTLVTGLGVATSITTDFTVSEDFALKFSQSYDWEDGLVTSAEYTTRWETSPDPFYHVGPEADVYIGNSTNIITGVVNSLNIVRTDKIDADVDILQQSADGAYSLIKYDAIGLGIEFPTVFAYTQKHIVEVLIPGFEKIRARKLLLSTVTNEDAQQRANMSHEIVYRSNLPHDHKDFGKLNTDKKAFGNEASPPERYSNGKSYTIFYPSRDKDGNEFTNFQDSILVLNQSIRNWEKIIADNEREKVFSKLDENLSFQGGAKIEKSKTLSGKLYTSHNFEFVIGASKEFETNALYAGLGTKIAVEIDGETSIGGIFDDSNEDRSTFGFVLEESGTDYISVDVRKPDMKRVYKDMLDNKEIDKEKYDKLIFELDEDKVGYIFMTRAGATSCPYEGEYVAKYFEPEANHIINQATARIEAPIIEVKDGKNIVSNVPSTRKAVFKLLLRNESETNDDRYFELKQVDENNPDGASFSIDGAALGDGRTFLVPAGTTLEKTLEVGKGTAMRYENLQLSLGSLCDWYTLDTVSVSAFFVPSCSDVKINLPNDKWTLNAETKNLTANGKYYMPVQLTNFDVNYENFDHIAIQYKPSAASDAEWVTLVKYYANEEKFAAAQGAKAMITGPTIDYQFVMGDLPDQNYDIVALSVCSQLTGNIETASNIVSGVKDTYRPRLFGSPQPANGILGISDEIRLNFNETIAQGYLTDNNFEVTGVRNGEIISRAASVRFDGANDYLETEALRNFAEKSFTVEMGIYRDKPNQNGTFFSHGNVNNSFEVGITTDKKVRVKVGDEVVVTDNPVAMKDGEWEHLAVVYENTAQPRVKAYYNKVQVIDKAVGAYTGVGNYNIGRSITETAGSYFTGKISELRVWESALSLGILNKNMEVSLQGSEVGLSAYYPMNEGRGDVVADKARGANAAMKAQWFINRDGFAAQFKDNAHLKLSTGALPLSKDMDYTVEFWFKGQPGQTNATLVSNGRGDNEEEGGSAGKLHIGFDAQGKLAVSSNGFTKTIEGNYLDNNWYHYALAVNRNIGRASIYINGRLNSYFDAGNLERVESASMYLGARAWFAKGDAETEIIDNHFNGLIDEFRIWDTYKNETLVYEENNVSLKGSEMGLFTYYPFETYIDWQGRKEMQFTLSDKTIRGANGAVVPDAVSKGVVGDKTDVAPVKERGPQAPIMVNYVVNNDALIITSAAANGWDSFEQSIVTFKVKGIQEVNGNKIASPISWTAFIDRNQLNWSQSEVNITKKVYEPHEFSLEVANLGGSEQRYTIENAPAWLKVQPSGGAIGPKSTQTIRFVVNEGLNVGAYSEILYLVNAGGVSRAVSLNMRVKGEEPAWKVNPADFKYSMSVYGKLRVNNLFSSDKEDMLAAFKDGKCVGVTRNVYNEDMDMWYTFLTVYSNDKQADGLEFRIWDALTGKVYGVTPDRAISFVNDAIIGSASSPVIFEGKEMLFQNIALSAGWNWISFNLANAQLSNINATLINGVWTKNDVVKNLENFDSYSAQNNSWIGSLSNNGGFNNTGLFMLFSTNNQTLSLSGSAINPHIMPISVRGGAWNYISFLPMVNYTVKEALAGYEAQDGDVVKSQNQFAMYSGNNWIGNLVFMEPGKGYMLKRTASSNVTFTYPSLKGSLNMRALMETRSSDSAPDAYLNRRHAENMNLIVAGNAIQEGDKVLTYVNGELCGKSEPVTQDNGRLNYINAVGGTGQGILTFALERNGNIIARAARRLAYMPNVVVGTPEEPFELNFDAESDRVAVYPNPFENELFVEISDLKNGDILEIVVNEASSGRTVFRQGPVKVNDSFFRMSLNAHQHNMYSGIYLVNVLINGNSTVQKVIKK